MMAREDTNRTAPRGYRRNASAEPYIRLYVVDDPYSGQGTGDASHSEEHYPAAVHMAQAVMLESPHHLGQGAADQVGAYRQGGLYTQVN